MSEPNEPSAWAALTPTGYVETLRAAVADRDQQWGIVLESSQAGYMAMIADRDQTIAAQGIMLRAADAVVRAIDQAVDGGHLGSRSAIADARLDYGDPRKYEAAENATIAVLTKRCDELQERFDFVTSAARVTAAQHTITAMQGERESLRAEIAALTAVIVGKDAALQEINDLAHEWREALVNGEMTLDDSFLEIARLSHVALALSPLSVRERAAAEAEALAAAKVVSTDLAQDCLEDPSGWNDRELSGWRRLSVSAADRLGFALIKLAALAAPGQA